MAFSGTIKLKGERSGDIGTFDVVDYKYSAHSPRDTASGQATGRVLGGIVEVTVTMKNEALLALQALYQNDIIKDSEINFNKPDLKSTFMKVAINKAAIIHFEQNFTSGTNDAFVVLIKITAQDLQFTAGDKQAMYEGIYGT
jgi:hypothetical protein